jgi:hypothetical protein
MANRASITECDSNNVCETFTPVENEANLYWNSEKHKALYKIDHANLTEIRKQRSEKYADATEEKINKLYDAIKNTPTKEKRYNGNVLETFNKVGDEYFIEKINMQVENDKNLINVPYYIPIPKSILERDYPQTEPQSTDKNTNLNADVDAAAQAYYDKRSGGKSSRRRKRTRKSNKNKKRKTKNIRRR